MKNMIKMVVTLSVISALAAGALAFADKVTRKKIAMQAKLKAARAVKKIFPDCLKPVERTVKSPGGETITVYDCPGKRSCFMFSSKSASGLSRPYSGLIKVMLGVDARGTIEGIEVIQQSETPGLGANIEEKSWLKQFKGLSLTKGKLAVKKVDRTGSIDAISGATISSKAVTSIVKAALEFHKSGVAGKGGKARRRAKRKIDKWIRRRKGGRRVPFDAVKYPRGKFIKGHKSVISDVKRRRERARQRGVTKPGKKNIKVGPMGSAPVMGGVQ